MAKGTASGDGRSEGSIQSIGRAFELLEHMADLGGVASISELGARSHLPVPTIHRMIRTLVDLGYVRQQPSRKYALGPGLIRLGDGASRLFGFGATAYLKELVTATGESANMALLNGDHVVYTASVEGLHSMRMFTEIGRRAWSHSTAVGKAILAQLPPEQVRAIVGPSGLPAQTPNTITSLEALEAELARIREQG
jgi:IclR family transcriptional regulator, acetate operon repressor